MALLWAELEAPFRAYLLTHRRSRSTAQTYIANVRLFARFCEAHSTNLIDADGSLIALYLADVLDRLSHNTAPLRLSCLRSFYKFCRSGDLRRDDPTEGLSVKWQTIPPRRPLSRPELVRLLAACRNPRDQVMITLAYDCGLRVSEVVGLREQHIDFDSGVLYIHGKGDKVGWVIPSQSMIDALRQFKGRPNGVLWWTRQGQPMTIKRAQRTIEQIGKRAGMHCHWHQLRTTFANAALQRGVRLEHLQVMMRHSDSSTTRHYAGHTINQQALDAMRGLNLAGEIIDAAS